MSSLQLTHGDFKAKNVVMVEHMQHDSVVLRPALIDFEYSRTVGVTATWVTGGRRLAPEETTGGKRVGSASGIQVHVH